MPDLGPLITPAVLAKRLGDPDVRIFDTTVFLRRPPSGGPYAIESGRSSYEQGHIPGAAFADVARALSDEDSPFPFTTPRPERFAAEAGRLGISPGVHVVVYAQESPMWATRFWWLLRVFGFDRVSVLDGGLPAWAAEGRELEVGSIEHAPSTFTGAFRPELLASRGEVEAVVCGDADARLLNALQSGAFRGEGPTSYSRPGRIPGSDNIPWSDVVDPDTFGFRGVNELKQLFEGVGPEPVIAYCGGGISATIDLFALSLIGREGARLYDGSLAEWTADPQLPVETG